MAGLRKHVLQTDPIISAARSGPSANHQHIADLRAQAVGLYNDLAAVMGRRRAAAEVIARGRSLWPGLKTTRRTLDRWRRQRREGGDLTPKWGRGGRRETRSSEAWAYFFSLYYNDRRIPIAVCDELTRAVSRARGWRWTESVRSTQKLLAEHEDLGARCLAREGGKAFEHRFAPYVEQELENLRPGDLFVSDHKRCRFHVRDGVRLRRPWVCFVQDRATGLIVGWRLVFAPNQDVILAALRRSFIDFCIPAKLKIDNGADYGAQVFHGKTKQQRRALAAWIVGQSEARTALAREAAKVACDRSEWKGTLRELGVEPMFALPLNPKAKSVERFNLTFDNRFGRLQPGWCGRTNLDRPESDKLLYNASARARDGKALTREQRERLAAIPTIEETERMVGEWLEREMARPRKALGGLSPAAMWAANPPDRPRAEENALNMLMRIRGAFTVGPNGVSVTIGSARLTFGRD